MFIDIFNHEAPVNKSLFQAKEILDMALQLEQRGISFYSACANASDAPQVKEVFALLENQEKMHYQIFARMKGQPADSLLPESYPGEYRSYIEAFVKNKVFDSSESAARKAERMDNPLDAVDWAVAFEQRSVDFYTALAEKVRSSDADAVNRIIAEEKRHIEQLHALRNALTSKRTGEEARDS